MAGGKRSHGLEWSDAWRQSTEGGERQVCKGDHSSGSNQPLHCHAAAADAATAVSSDAVFHVGSSGMHACICTVFYNAMSSVNEATQAVHGMGAWLLSFVFAHDQPHHTLAALTCIFSSSVTLVHCCRWLNCVHWPRPTPMRLFQPCLPTQHRRRQPLLQLQRCCRRSLGKRPGQAMLTTLSASAAPQAQTGSHPQKDGTQLKAHL